MTTADLSPVLTPNSRVPDPASFGALRHRNFRLFIIGQFISLCGTWVQVVAQGWLAYQLTKSPFWLGVVSALGSAPVLIFTLWGGVLADGANKRLVILWLQAGMLVEALLMGVLTVSGHINIYWIGGLALFSGLLSAFEIPMRQAFFVELVGREDLMNAIALNSSAFNVSRVLGPAMAGAAMSAFGAGPCFLLNAVSFLAVIIGLIQIRLPAHVIAAHGRPRATIRDGLRYVFGSPWARSLVVLSAVFTIFGSSFIAMLPAYATNVLHTGEAGFGGLNSAFGLGAALSAISVAAWGHRWPRGRVALYGGVVLGGTLITLGLSQVYWLSFGLMVLAGLAIALNAIMTNSTLQLEAPDHLRGQVVGFYSFIVIGLMPFGSLQAGWVSQHLGVPRSLTIGGAACLLMAVWTTYVRLLRGKNVVVE